MNKKLLAFVEIIGKVLGNVNMMPKIATAKFMTDIWSWTSIASFRSSQLYSAIKAAQAESHYTVQLRLVIGSSSNINIIITNLIKIVNLTV